jgi:hypothetical protein
MNISSLAVVPLMSLLFVSCQPVKDGPVFNSVILHWLSPPKPSPKPLSADEQKKSNLGALLHEMFEVVLLREPVGQGEFDSLWNPLLQGASIEGIYNGLVHSSRYQELEQKTGKATPLTLQVFQQELTILESALPHPTDFSDVKFSEASLFTLKRILGDEALKVMDAKSVKPTELAVWYGPWTARLASMKIDFGLPLRSNTDPKFHQEWALSQKDPGFVVWEVLDRVHRVLDVAEERGLKK